MNIFQLQLIFLISFKIDSYTVSIKTSLIHLSIFISFTSKSSQMQSNRSLRANSLANEISDRLYKNRGTTGDIKFKIGNVEIPAHKCVLAAFSPKYQRQFYGDFDDKNCDCIELKEPNVSASAFNEYLQFFYLNHVELTHENVADVLFLTKESLVDEFHNECIKFIRETLSIENVCQIYELAMLHDYNDLLLSCERLIKSNFTGVFITKGFLSSDRSMILNIIRLAGTNCRAKCVFDACISWAQNFCAENQQDPNNNEHLREVLGDLLYEIRFDTMKFEEFIQYYQPFRNLFTEDEREEILKLIGKIKDFQPQWFKCIEHPIATLSSTIEADECSESEKNNMITCNRVFVKMSSQTPYQGVYKTSFSCTNPLELDAIFCGTLYNDSDDAIVENRVENHHTHPARVKIIEKTSSNEFSSVCEHIVYEEQIELTFQTHVEACIKLRESISITPFTIYEISITFFGPIYLQTYEYKDHINIENGIIRFYDDFGPVTGLRFLPEENNELGV